ncbi:hypothetical protein RB195_022585 [Necator americanus]|uniref:Uncharacterized protein n=1 Tax=Necator americanus TaxID=51031 RepID=A0ABR1EFT3_NECAM
MPGSGYLSNTLSRWSSKAGFKKCFMGTLAPKIIISVLRRGHSVYSIVHLHYKKANYNHARRDWSWTPESGKQRRVFLRFRSQVRDRDVMHSSFTSRNA